MANSTPARMSEMTFEQLLAAHRWRSIPGCPGRYSLPRSPTSPEVMAGGAGPSRIARLPGARDPVHVIAFEGGGLISYARPDGTFVHTLNTADGFQRKLKELGFPEPP